MFYAIPTDYGMKIKESKKINKYLDLARELKTLRNMSDGDTNVVDELGTIP